MFNRLVQFTKRGDLFTEIKDFQYHLFTNCNEPLDFVFDPLYKDFIAKGYVWSAIDFEQEWADLIGFTCSECIKIK